MKTLLLDLWFILSVALFIINAWVMWILPQWLWDCFYLSNLFLGLTINLLLSLNILLYKESVKKLGSKD